MAGGATGTPGFTQKTDPGLERGVTHAGPAHPAATGETMTFIAKPKIAHPSLPKKPLGFTRRDYEGALSTLCAGCGHDSITAAIVEAAWEAALEPRTWSSSRASVAHQTTA